MGARPFFEDLVEQMTVTVEKQFLRVSSYREAVRPGRLELVMDIECELEDRDVIIVQDKVRSRSGEENLACKCRNR